MYLIVLILDLNMAADLFDVMSRLQVVSIVTDSDLSTHKLDNCLSLSLFI